ncbi:hypothetical protein GCM10023315_16940 [Algibacter aquimarinus]|uniref:Restriction endonuclease n=2 Tax=Algibacter aquimarinus TaxID=1136748 RepID=A0ABP9HD59_9FLAO
MTPQEINKLEQQYFNFLIKLFEEKGTTFTKNLLSQYAIRDKWNNYQGDMSFIQRGLENVIQGILFENVDWEICSTPEGADSVFQTSRAVIHIDAKAYKHDDGDALGNKITVQGNQTSYFTDAPLIYSGFPFKSNLPISYKHKVYGEVPSLTYFLKLTYDLSNELDSFRKFKLFLYCIPNGTHKAHLGIKFFQAGRGFNSRRERTSIRPNFNKLVVDLNDEFKWKRYHELDMI